MAGELPWERMQHHVVMPCMLEHGVCSSSMKSRNAGINMLQCKPRHSVKKIKQKYGASPSCLHNVKDALALKFHTFLRRLHYCKIQTEDQISGVAG